MAIRSCGLVLAVATLTACPSSSNDSTKPIPSELQPVTVIPAVQDHGPDAAASDAASPDAATDRQASAAPMTDGGAAGDASTDTRPLHADTDEALRALLPPFPKNKEGFVERTFGIGTPARSNQGNIALAEHLRSRQACLDGLAGIELQTEEQRAVCKGEVNMVPVYKNGRMKSAKTCIDIFEFPNKACELPFVWIGPTQAEAVCGMQGKRLCTQDEWINACAGDPEGGKNRRYAYGDDLDLDICHTNKPHRLIDGTKCDPDSAGSAWKTCATDTEPSGSFPRCRSRFGVFDQHGNVAEIMTRLDPDGAFYSQLKGSAFFYVEVKRAPEERMSDERRRTTYSDVCAHDPRWHVEPIREAWHVNYHLGFRCCKTVN